MTSYSLKYEHVPLVDIDGRKVVIDTGAPCSLDANSQPLSCWEGICETVQHQTRNHPDETGEHPDELWGVDKLKFKTLRFDLAGRQLFLEEATANPSNTGQRLKSEVVGGLPVITVLIAGKERRLVLDTGCHHGYVLDISGMGATQADMIDHSPQVDGGHFSVPAFRGELKLLTQDSQSISCGPVDFGRVEVVDGVGAMLAYYGVDGVVGGNVFRQHVIEFSDRMRRVAVVDRDLSDRPRS